MNLSRCCRESISQTETLSMDRESVEKLLRQIQKASMDRRCIKICQEKKPKNLDRYQATEKLSSLIQTSFKREEKYTEMNAIKHATQLKIQTTF